MKSIQIPGDTNYHQLNRWVKGSGLVLLLLSLMVGAAQAQQQPSQILNNALGIFQSNMSGVESQMLGVAKTIFMSLFTIEVVWSGVKYVLDRDNPASLLKDLTALLVQRAMIAVVVWNGPQFMRMITGTFTQLGQQVGQGVNINSASGLMDTGLQAMSALWGNLSASDMLTSPAVVLVSVAAGMILLLSFAVAALQMFMTTIEFYIVASGAVFMLGFFGSKVTKQFAEKYISFVIGSGIKMFTIYLVVGSAMPLVTSVTALAQGATNDMNSLGVIMASSIVIAFLTWSIPGLAASIAAGTVNTNAAGLLGTAGSLAAGGMAAAGASAVVGRQGAVALGGVGSGISGAGQFFGASKASGMSTMGAAGSTARASLGAAASAIGSAVSDSVGGSSAIQNSLGGRAGSAMSGQAEQMRAAMPAGGAPAPSVDGAASASAAPSVDGGGASAPSVAADAVASASPAATSSPGVERGSSSSAAPRVAPPAPAQQTGLSHHIGNLADAATPPAEASATVGAGFTFNSDH